MSGVTAARDEPVRRDVFIVDYVKDPLKTKPGSEWSGISFCWVCYRSRSADQFDMKIKKLFNRPESSTV